MHPAVDAPPTILGRPWTTSSWRTPFLAWAITAVVAIALVEARSRELLTVPTWAVWCGGVAATLVLLVIAAAITAGAAFTDGSRGYMVLSALGMGGWLTVVTATDSLWTRPYGYAAWLCLALMTALGVGTWHPARVGQIAHEEQQRYLAAGGRLDDDGGDEYIHDVLTEEQQEAARWEQLLEVAGAPGLIFHARIPNKAGFALHFSLPDDGSVTFAGVAGLTEKLEVIFGRRLPELRREGARPGSIRVRRARDKRGRKISTEIYIYVDVRDVLAETLMIPDEHTALSVYNAFPVGEFTNGETIYLTLAEIHVMIGGQTGKGKSALLDLMLHQLSRCVDVVLWVFDGKGGRLVRTWIDPYLRRMIDPATGRPLDRPIFDWVAIDRAEGERMFTATIIAAKTRPGLMPVGTKWRATTTEPVIILVCDELSQLVGDFVGPNLSDDQSATSGQLSALLTQCVSLGRGEGVWVITANQRTTVTAGASGDAKANFGGRIVLPVASTSEATEALQKSDTDAARLAASLEHPGSVVIEGFGLPQGEPGKLWWVGDGEERDKRVVRAVLEHTQHRPKLDDGTARGIEAVGYLTRWTDPDRTAWMYGRTGRPQRWTADPAPQQGGAATMLRPQSTVERLGLAEHASPDNPFTAAPAGGDGPDFDAEWTAIADLYDEEMTERFDQVAAEANGAAQPVDGAALAGQLGLSTAPRPGTYEAAKRAMVEILDAAGPAGIAAPAMYAALRERKVAPAARTTIYTWLTKLADEGKADKPTGGNNGLYYAPHHWR